MEYTPKPSDPAKAFLRRYRALVLRQESLQRSIDAAYDRAYSRTARLKPINVQNTTVYDRMAEDIALISDETELLKATKADVDKSIAEILEAIDSVHDEMQKTVLTLRHVEGLEWSEVQQKIGYEKSQSSEIYGWALKNIMRWLEKKGLLEKSPNFSGVFRTQSDKI